MQSVDSINEKLEESLKNLHDLQKRNDLTEQEKGTLNYWHGVVRALRWVRKNTKYASL